MFVKLILSLLIGTLLFLSGMVYGITKLSKICLKKGLMYYDINGHIQYTELNK